MSSRGLLLCSKSPRRHQILSDFNVNFKEIPNLLMVEPNLKKNESPVDYAARLATLKVLASRSNFNGLIMGVDTVVFSQGKVFGKPKDSEAAIAMLNELMGRSHIVVSACALFNSSAAKFIYCIDYAKIKFKQLPDEIIINYLKTFKPFDKAGGYGIQDKPPFLESLNGDYFTVMGLPINRLLKLLKTYGIVKK